MGGYSFFHYELGKGYIPKMSSFPACHLVCVFNTSTERSGMRTSRLCKVDAGLRSELETARNILSHYGTLHHFENNLW